MLEWAVELHGVRIEWRRGAATNDAPAGHRHVIAADAYSRYWAFVPKSWRTGEVVDTFTRGYECTYSTDPTIRLCVPGTDGLREVGTARLDEDGEIASLAMGPWPY